PRKQPGRSWAGWRPGRTTTPPSRAGSIISYARRARIASGTSRATPPPVSPACSIFLTMAILTFSPCGRSRATAISKIPMHAWCRTASDSNLILLGSRRSLRRLERYALLGLMNRREFLLDMAREHEFGRALPIERDFGPHRSFGARTENGDLEGLPWLRDRRFGCRRLVAAMGHAVGALFVSAGAVGIPIRGVHQFMERLGIAFAEQVTGFLPTEDVAGGHAPGRAVIGLVSGKKIEIEVRVDEIPFLTLAHAEDLPEQLLGLSAAEEVLLVGRALVGITRRDRHADAEPLAVIEESRDVCGGVAGKDRGVDVDGEAVGLPGLDRRHRAIEYARLTDRLVVVLAQPIEVDGEEEIRRRLE